MHVTTTTTTPPAECQTHTFIYLHMETHLRMRSIMSRQAGSSISPSASAGTSTNWCRAPSAKPAAAPTTVPRRLRAAVVVGVAPRGSGPDGHTRQTELIELNALAARKIDRPFRSRRGSSTYTYRRARTRTRRDPPRVRAERQQGGPQQELQREAAPATTRRPRHPVYDEIESMGWLG